MYTYIMRRTQIYLSGPEDAALEREARATGHTKSRLIRDAIDRVYVAAKRVDALEALEASRGRWSRTLSGEAWVERRRLGRLARLHEVKRGRRR
jgi:hypothetical protein